MPPRPWKATLCLTYVCNLHCGFCLIWKRRPEGEFTLGEWQTFLEKAPRFRWIDLTGGEPTIRPDFYEIVEAAIRIHRPWLLHFPTNGSFPDRLSEIERYSKRTRIVVTVSIDGPRALHDRMRGTAGSFDLAIESLKLLRSLHGVKSVVGMTLTAENQDSVEAARREIADLVPDFHDDELHLNLAQVSEHYYGNESAAFQPAARFPKSPLKIWPLTELAASVLERRYQELVPRFIETGRTPMPCKSMEASIFVDPKGRVYPCISDQRVVGELRHADYDLGRILDSDHASYLRGEIERGSCAHCWTPCEAYPTIIESALPFRTRTR